MPNNRVFYASHAVAVGPGTGQTTVQGAQSVSLNTNFNLEQVFQLGRLAIYDNVALDPEVEVTVNKALDGHQLIWSLAVGAFGGSLVGEANTEVKVVLGIGNDTDEFIQVAGQSAVTMTGCFISGLNYTFPVDGNFTEEVTFIGTSKEVTGAVLAPTPDPEEVGLDTGSVVRRQNLMLDNGTGPQDPNNYGLRAGATNNVAFPDEVIGKRLSQVSISADLGREAIYELGRFEPYHRFVNFPLEITCAFDVIAATHDGVEVNLATASNCETPNDIANEQTIRIYICDSSGSPTYKFDLGNKCTLQSVAYSGGDTGGGNVTITYTYVTYNTLKIISDATAVIIDDGTDGLPF